MDCKEAIEWMNGERSMVNMTPQNPFETWNLRIAQSDAAMTQQAYWVLRAHKEGLMTRGVLKGEL